MKAKEPASISPSQRLPVQAFAVADRLLLAFHQLTARAVGFAATLLVADSQIDF